MRCVGGWCGVQPLALPGVLANLLALEKKTRLAADAKSTVLVCTAIIQACWDAKDYKGVNEHISILTKRRAQLQKAIESVIQHGAKLAKEIDTTQSGAEEIQRELIETLRTVSSGKMFVELERAQLTKILADMEERAGNVKEAADILQEIQVETIGSMDVQEKADYLLEQVRLVLLKKDYVRTEIIAKKLAVKQFNEGDAKTNPKWQELKMKYYSLMIEYHKHFSHYLEITKAYREIFNTARVQADPAQWKEILTKLVIYGILSPWDAELSDILNRIATEKKLEQLPAVKSVHTQPARAAMMPRAVDRLMREVGCSVLTGFLLRLFCVLRRSVLDEFIGDEIMNWPLSAAAEFKSNSTFTDASAVGASSSAMSDVTPAVAPKLSDELDVSETEDERKEGASSGAQRWNDLHKRIVQHNIRVVGGYYGKITSTRLGQLLKLEPSKTEVLLSEMVSSKQLVAKIDRPQGIITFTKPQPATEILNSYANDLSSLLSVVEKTCHMINKENMIHKIK
jgi:26S proteasome regulatory subunit N5